MIVGYLLVSFAKCLIFNWLSNLSTTKLSQYKKHSTCMNLFLFQALYYSFAQKRRKKKSSTSNHV